MQDTHSDYQDKDSRSPIEVLNLYLVDVAMYPDDEMSTRVKLFFTVLTKNS